MKDHVALTNCYFCGEGSTILLATRYIRLQNGETEPLKDLKEFNGKVVDMTPCSKCQQWMKEGIILITIDERKCEKDWNKEAMPNPWRTGGFYVVKEEAIKRLLSGKMLEWCLKHRWMFIDNRAAIQAGLSKLKAKPEPTERN